MKHNDIIWDFDNEEEDINDKKEYGEIWIDGIKSGKFYKKVYTVNDNEEDVNNKINNERDMEFKDIWLDNFYNYSEYIPYWSDNNKI